MSARLFFALWPSPQLQSALAAWGAALCAFHGGKPTRDASVHLTLAFLGSVDETSIASVLRIGEDCRGQSFTLDIDQAGCWRHNGIVWAAPQRTPPALSSLVRTLESALRRAGFALDERDYQPHITLLRRARCRRVDWHAPEVIHWPVDRFVLVRSRQTGAGSEYEQLQEWPLGSPATRGG